MKKCVWVVAILALGGGWSTFLQAAVPSVIPYQGRLTDAAGTPLNGSYSIRFSLWNSGAGGSELWSETQAAVTVANGLFQVSLGSVSAIPASIFTGSDLYLEIKVGADPAMTPRQRLGTTAYAFRSGVVPALASASASSVTPASGATENMVSLTANFPAPGYAFVTGNLWFETAHSNGTTSNFSISVSDVSATHDASSRAYNYTSSAAPTHTYDGTLHTQGTFTIGSAGPKAFYFIGSNISGSQIAAGARLSVMYFPDAIGPVSEPQGGQNAEPATAAERMARERSRP